MSEAPQYQWIMPIRVADTSQSVPDDIHDLLGLAGVIEAADRCYDIRSLGHHFSPDVLSSREDEWIRAALGLAGSVAESIVVCVACEVEIELLRRNGQRRAEIGGRFFSIASSSELIGVGHRLVNLIARLVSARTAWRQLLLDSADRDVRSFAAINEPRSSKRSAWLSLNEPTATRLGEVLEPVGHDSVQLALDELISLAASHEWSTLAETRGEVFHRSRPESSVAAGVDGSSGFLRALEDANGVAIGYAVQSEPVRYAGGDNRWVEEAISTNRALRRLASSSSLIVSAAAAMIEPATQGRHQALLGDSGFRPQRHHGRCWDDATCSCCDRSGSVHC